MLFSSIYGLHEIKQTLIQSVKNGHVAHAQLFWGAEGSAALALAMAYVTYINCENKGEEDSCGVCPSCSKMSRLVHPDLLFVYPSNALPSKEEEREKARALLMQEWRSVCLENPYIGLSDWISKIGAENKQSQISVEEARNIIKSVSMKAFEAEYKAVIIWLPELMNVAAANTLLKVLEEPPSKTLFILVTTDVHKNLPTILSRCQTVKVRLFTDEEVSAVLLNKHDVELEQAAQIAFMAGGDLNRAIQLSGEVDQDNLALFRDWMRACYGRNVPSVIQLSDDFQRLSKEGQKGFFTYGMGLMRELLLLKSGASNLVKTRIEEKNFVESFGKVVTEEAAEQIVPLLEQNVYYIERNANVKLVFLDLSFEMMSVLAQGQAVAAAK